MTLIPKYQGLFLWQKGRIVLFAATKHSQESCYEFKISGFFLIFAHLLENDLIAKKRFDLQKNDLRTKKRFENHS